MTATNTARKAPAERLAAADAAFAAGKYDEGSELLFQAVAGALAQLAEVWGQPCDSRAELRAFARWLDEKHGADGCHALNLSTAHTLHDNAKYHFMPPDDIDFCRPVVREFVTTLLSYRQKAAPYG